MISPFIWGLGPIFHIWAFLEKDLFGHNLSYNDPLAVVEGSIERYQKEASYGHIIFMVLPFLGRLGPNFHIWEFFFKTYVDITSVIMIPLQWLKAR